MTTLHKGDRAIATRTIAGIEKGRAYQVEETHTEYTDFGAAVPTVVVTTWPERNPVKLAVRAGMMHLRVAARWTML